MTHKFLVLDAVVDLDVRLVDKLEGWMSYRTSRSSYLRPISLLASKTLGKFISND